VQLRAERYFDDGGLLFFESFDLLAGFAPGAGPLGGRLSCDTGVEDEP
jgi:hypothetical protein